MVDYSGGAGAQKGFNFQTISGLFYGFILTYNEKDFIIEFEDKEDIIVKTGAEVLSIQAKSEKITESMLTKKGKSGKSVIDKMIEVSYDEGTIYRIVVFPQHNATSKILDLKKEILKEDIKDIECRVMPVNYEDVEEIFLHEMPFIANLAEAKIYIVGYATTKIGPFSEQYFDSLIYKAKELSELPPGDEKKIGLDTDFFSRYLINSELYKVTEDFCASIFTLTSSWSLSEEVKKEIQKFREQINPNLEKVSQIVFTNLGDGNLIEFAESAAKKKNLSKATVLAYYFIMEVQPSYEI